MISFLKRFFEKKRSRVISIFFVVFVMVLCLLLMKSCISLMGPKEIRVNDLETYKELVETSNQKQEERVKELIYVLEDLEVQDNDDTDAEPFIECDEVVGDRFIEIGHLMIEEAQYYDSILYLGDDSIESFFYYELESDAYRSLGEVLIRLGNVIVDKEVDALEVQFQNLEESLLNLQKMRGNH